MTKKIPAVFLDRDGTLIHEAEYLKEVEGIKLFDSTFEAIKKLNENNILAIVVSNQSGVARGYFDENTVKLINDSMNDMLKEKSANLDGFYYCPHHPKGTVKEYAINCNCRKPLAGMIKNALNDFSNIDISRSYMVGDKVCDVELGKNAGCKSILVKTGYGNDEMAKECRPDFVANDILDAVEMILADLRK